MNNILATIKAHKLEEVAAAKRTISLAALMIEAQAQPPAPGFAAALRGTRKSNEPRRGQPRLIAEIKKASPSAGIIRADFDPVEIAKAYSSGGADAISCLTDERFFHGSLDYLRQIKNAVDIPVLRKEFIIDPWQVWESRAAGADAILLIAGMVDWQLQKALREAAKQAGLDVLLEIHADEELEPALAIGPDLLGINNRDLRTRDLATDLSTTLRLAARVPLNFTLVSESGIRTADDVKKLAEAGIDAILVGEHLMREADPGAAIAGKLGLAKRT